MGVHEVHRHMVVVASGDVRAPSIVFGIIISGGNIQLGKAGGSVIICDGDFEAKWLESSLVIARGKVTLGGDVSGCTIISGGCIVRPRGVNVSRCAMRSHEIPNVVKFFDPSAAGLTVWQVDRDGHPIPDGNQLTKHGQADSGDGLLIKEIRKGTPFAAGLRTGDLITAIGGTKTPSKEIFRKVLRRKLAEGGPILSFTVKRSGKPVDVPIPIKD